MREPVEKTIDGEQYTFCQLPPKQSLKLMVRLARLLGAPIGTAINGMDPAGLTSANADLDVGAIVSALCSRLDENEVEAVVDALLSQVIHQGHGEVDKHFDLIFGGRLPHLFKVLAAALQVEYGDFLADGGALAAWRQKLAGATTPARST